MSTIRYEVVQIDAGREPEGSWCYNDLMFLDVTVELPEELHYKSGQAVTRAILKTLRSQNVISDNKGFFSVEEVDDWDYEVQIRSNQKPVFLLRLAGGEI